MIELLDQDDRPTFVLDLATPRGTSSTGFPFPILHANPALRVAEGLLDAISTEPTDNPEAAEALANFKNWALANPSRSQEAINIASLPSFTFAGVSWSASTLRRRFRVVRAQCSWNPASSLPALSPGLKQTATMPRSSSFALTMGSDEPVPDDDLPPVVTTPVDEPSISPFTDEELPGSGYFPENVRAPLPPLREDILMHYTDAFSLESPNKIVKEEKPSFDWTRIPVTTDMPAHFRFARSVDWASTPLGPIEDWSDDLRAMSNMVMASPHPAALYWGPQFVVIYNEAYVVMAGKKHPKLMGQKYGDAWTEIWDGVGPAFENACRSGQATMKHEDLVFMNRHGFLEEAWFSWSIVPLVGSDGSIVGLYNPAVEDTQRKITERRMHTLRQVGVQIATSRDLKMFWNRVTKGLAFNELDVPFALIYSVGDDSESEVSSQKSGNIAPRAPRIVLEGAIGTPENHPVAIKYLDLSHSDEGFAPYLKQSMSRRAPIVLRKEDGTFPEHLVEGLMWRGYGDPSHTIVIFPVHPTTATESVVGFVVLATNPRRPFNEDFELFIQLLSRQLDTSTASIILFEEEIKKGQRAAKMAALDRQELAKLLDIRTQEAEESEYKFTRMAEFAPVGMFIADSEGQMSYCNDTWWELSRHPRSEENIHMWMQSVREEDRPGVEAVWKKLITDKVTVTHEFRFKYTREQNGHAMDAWVILSAFPERNDAGGGIKCIFGSITDISQQKWAENVQIQRREEAMELKRQQENFIDITSHEMRNPLSAILQCADEIVESLQEYRKNQDKDRAGQNINEILDNCIEAAATVSLCAGHQKRIVDDVLTLSKLDSKMLLVTPVDVKPVDVVQQVMKMFEPELNSNEITAEFKIQQSFRDLNVDWVKLDPSRLMQVLINLMTNSIKFTQSCAERKIVVTLGASKDMVLPIVSQSHSDMRPLAVSHPPVGGVSFFPRKREDEDQLTSKPGWGEGERINLHFAVTDTGQGLGADEMSALFQRFSQASPRTHVKYGGSGLGLFISRILTELQGGQIGVTSEKGYGSTFAFYIRSRKSDGPSDTNVARKTGEHIRKLTAAPPDAAKVILATSNTTATMMSTLPPSTVSTAPSRLPASTMPQAPGSFSTSTHNISTGDLTQSSYVPSPIITQGTSIFSSANQINQLDRATASISRDILVVEDNIVNQKVLKKQLSNAGHKARVANHGGEALDIIKHSRYWNGSPPPPTTASPRRGSENPLDRANLTPGTSGMGTSGADNRLNISVILMDLEMPVMDGMTCARQIRELEASGTIGVHFPIIAVTAYARPEQIEDAKKAGIDDVISKPFRIPELIPKIEENIARWS